MKYDSDESPLRHLATIRTPMVGWKAYDEQIAALSRRYQAGDEEALEMMFADTSWLVFREAAKYRMLDPEDAVAEGFQALLSVCKTWNPDKGWKFSSMAKQVINRELTRSVQRLTVGMGVSRRVAEAHAKIRREMANRPGEVTAKQVAEELKISKIVFERTQHIREVFNTPYNKDSYHNPTGFYDYDHDPFDEYERNEQSRVLSEITKFLTDEEREILHMVTGEKMRVKDVAKALDLPESHIRAVHKDAMTKCKGLSMEYVNPF